MHASSKKHFTLDRALPGPDHAASLEPGELTDLVAGIRAVSLALGHSEKTPGSAGLRNARVARKSLVAARPIRRGEAFRPGQPDHQAAGLRTRALYYWSLLGTVADRDYAADEPIGDRGDPAHPAPHAHPAPAASLDPALRDALLSKSPLPDQSAGGTVALLFGLRTTHAAWNRTSSRRWTLCCACCQANRAVRVAAEINALDYLRFVVDDPKVSTCRRSHVVQGSR